MKYLLFVLPIIVNIILFVMDILIKNGLNGDWIHFWIVFNEWCVPIALVIINFIFNKNAKWYKVFLIFIGVIMADGILRYANWGITTGKMFNPDDESLMVAIYMDNVFPILQAMIEYAIFRRCYNIYKRRKKGTPI